MRRLSRNLIISLLLWAGLAGHAAASRIYIKDLNGLLTKGELATLRAVMAREVDFHKQALSLYDPLFVPIKMFRTRQEYRQYADRRGSVARPSGGFYSPLRREIVLYKHREYMKTLLHEAQHLVFAAGLTRPPTWLNEALSEVYEMAEVREEGVFTRVNTQHQARLVEWQKAGDLPQLSSFFALSYDGWESLVMKPEPISYPLSWGVGYFLMSSGQGRQAIHDTIRYIRDTDWRYQGVIYPGGLEALEADFHQFVRNMPAEYEL